MNIEYHISYSENVLEHRVYTVSMIYSAGFDVVEGFVKPAFTFFPFGLGDGDAVYGVENLLQVGKNGFVFDIDCQLCHKGEFCLVVNCLISYNNRQSRQVIKDVSGLQI